MRDGYGRDINYMRISVTDRCNLRCKYCMPENPQFLTHADILSYEELLRICSAAVNSGITRFKITGGEPFVRKGIVYFLRELKKMPGVEQVTITTNGLLLESYVDALAGMGIDGVNISLDTPDEARYRQLTGISPEQARHPIETILTNIHWLLAVGIPVKINTVVTEQSTFAEMERLFLLVKDEPLALRFIDEMPMLGEVRQGLCGAQIRAGLQERGYVLRPYTKRIGNGPAVYDSVQGCEVLLGYIEPVHGKFCGSCNRLRLTADGRIKPCLYAPACMDLRGLVRSGAQQAAIAEMLYQAALQKPAEHRFEKSPAGYGMNQIGG